MPGLTCAVCAKAMKEGTGTLPQGQAMCRPCRRQTVVNPKKVKTRSCLRCGGPAFRQYCSQKCANTANNTQRRLGDRDASKVNRFQRASAAPGLNEKQRSRLLAQWRKQHRKCAYCPALADTVDHVIPLLRGGSNHEGNLAPACRRCNSGKQAMLLMEWRTGRRCTVGEVFVPTQRQPRPKRTPTATPLALSICPPCGALYEGSRRYCSEACMWEWNNRAARERYRAKVGLPPTWERPSKPHPQAV